MGKTLEGAFDEVAVSKALPREEPRLSATIRHAPTSCTSRSENLVEVQVLSSASRA
jgi:hypothetical protein